jgi:hypothetical protein
LLGGHLAGTAADGMVMVGLVLLILGAVAVIAG